MRRLRTALLLATLVAAGACGDSIDADSGPNPEARLHLGGPPVGTVIEGDEVELEVSATGVAIVKADGDTSGRTAHYHVFIDRSPVRPGEVIPVAPDVIHTAASPIEIEGLTNGHHQIFVVLGDGTHHRLGKSMVHTSVHVRGGVEPAEPEDEEEEEGEHAPAGEQHAPTTQAPAAPAPAEQPTATTEAPAPAGH